MPSFDIASSVDIQTLDNAINIVKKEITNRFDFKGNHVVIELNKKEYVLKLESDSEMKIQQIVDVLISRAMKQGIEASAFDFSKDAFPSGKIFKKDISVKNGLKQEDAKKVVKHMPPLLKSKKKRKSVQLQKMCLGLSINLI